MLHSYLTTVVLAGKDVGLPILGGNALKNRKGDLTTEGLHMKNLSLMTTRVNFRKFKSLTHTDEERALRKEISKNGAKAAFKNEKLLHYKVF